MWLQALSFLSLVNQEAALSEEASLPEEAALSEEASALPEEASALSEEALSEAAELSSAEEPLLLSALLSEELLELLEEAICSWVIFSLEGV